MYFESVMDHNHWITGMSTLSANVCAQLDQRLFPAGSTASENGPRFVASIKLTSIQVWYHDDICGRLWTLNMHGSLVSWIYLVARHSVFFDRLHHHHRLWVWCVNSCSFESHSESSCVARQKAISKNGHLVCSFLFTLGVNFKRYFMVRLNLGKTTLRQRRCLIVEAVFQ